MSLAGFSASRAASAQDLGPERPKAALGLVAPKPRQALSAPYPEGGTGEVTVRLVVVVNADGSVRSAVAEGEASAFTRAAEQAARAWSFEPALRAGKPVAATIRVEIAFRPPPPQEILSDAPPPSAPPAARRVPAEEPIDVTVEGERPAPGVATLGRAEVRLLPGAFGDPFRAIDALPGVTPIATGIPFFYVRGAPPGNVGYFLDEVRVPLLYHLALGPSVIHPELVERVDLYRGGYPAAYGRYAGGIVAGEIRQRSEQLRAHGNIRLFDAGALVESPFAEGRAHALVGGRYSYTAGVLSLVAPEISLAYWDYQGRAGVRLSDRDEVSAFVFGSYDYLGERRGDGRVQTLFSTQFHRADLRYDHRVGSRLHLRSAVTLGVDVTGLEEGAYLVGRSLRGRSELRYGTKDEGRFRLGTDVGVNQYDVELMSQEREVRGLFPSRYDVNAGAYLEATLPLWPELEVTAGLRVDLYGSDGAAALSTEPRLAARYRVDDDVTIVHAYGFAAQPPAFVVPVPGFDIGALRGGLQRSFQASAGVELALPASLKATVGGFRNVFWNLNDTLGVARADSGDPNEALDTRSRGSAYGLEVFLVRSFERDLAGYLSYTLSRSTRTVGDETFPAAFDRTHVLSGAISYHLGRGWRAGTRATFYTGAPRRGDDHAETHDPMTGQRIDAPPAEAPERLPPFFRLDLRLEKRWQVSKTGFVSLVLEGLNVTAQKEVFSVDCNPNGCRSEEIGPVAIPNLGVEGGF